MAQDGPLFQFSNDRRPVDARRSLSGAVRHAHSGVGAMSGTTALLIATLGLIAAPPAAPPRHLFLDPEFLAEKSGVVLHVNPAERRERVIVADRPWEKLMISLFLTVLDDGGKLRMWYI